MDKAVILYAVLILGVLGLLLGFMLAYASKKLHVERSERHNALLALLPGANCGACGYSACGQLAEALLAGKEHPDACPVGGDASTRKLADFLGVKLTKNTRMTALVRCSGGSRARTKFQYNGIDDCNAALLVGGNGPMECASGCLGMGTCVSACRFGAISVRDGVAVVDHDRCTGCNHCIKACPKDLIVAVPYTADVVVACSSQEKGVNLKQVCEIGCLGCNLCQRVCKHNAIHVSHNLAVIDYDKCTGCGDCAERCPRKLIVDAKLEAGTWRPNAEPSELFF